MVTQNEWWEITPRVWRRTKKSTNPGGAKAKVWTGKDTAIKKKKENDFIKGYAEVDLLLFAKIRESINSLSFFSLRSNFLISFLR